MVVEELAVKFELKVVVVHLVAEIEVDVVVVLFEVVEVEEVEGNDH